MSHRLGDEEHQRILQTFNEPEFVDLPPGQIVPVLTERGLIMVSERSFYLVLRTHCQAYHLQRTRLPQKLIPAPRLRSDGPD